MQVNITSKVDDKLKCMKDDMSETLEIERRRSNSIFHGVKEEDNDDGVRHLIEEILGSGLNLDPNRHIEEVCRIGKRASGKIRPVCIKTKSKESKMEILQRAKQLKDHVAFKKVFITPDLMRKQQEVDKKLWDKLKKLRTNGSDEYRIKCGKIVTKILQGVEEVVYPLQS